MAKEEQLHRLKYEGVDAWNAWRNQAGKTGGGAFTRADLSMARLTRADLGDADLSETNLSWANLSWANLSGATLDGADLTGANLFEADLSGALLAVTNLSGADLSGANLSGAYFLETILANVDLSGQEHRLNPAHRPQLNRHPHLAAFWSSAACLPARRWPARQADRLPAFAVGRPGDRLPQLLHLLQSR